ncbi:MAG: cation diffusion facilitator family transporter [Actinobacteria bacterium]|nr:cation diffusion facilitator family transporter [Actinomycetota bacterium]
MAHEHSAGEAGKNLIISIVLNLFIVVFEIVFGILSRSVALISDALHNITDIGSMALSFGGEKIAAWPANEKKTYGYKRAEVIIAFTNAGILLAVIAFIIIEAIGRLFHPEEVAGLQMIIVASVALVGNGIATYLLEKNAHDNLNLKSAWLHSFQDAIFSLAVIVGAAGIYYTGWNWLDSALSLLISVFLLKEVFRILKESLAIMLDSVPADIDFVKVKDALKGLPGIVEALDLHIWQAGSQTRFLSVHIKTDEMNNSVRFELIVKIKKLLYENFNINHSAVQILSLKEAEKIETDCEHCN